MIREAGVDVLDGRQRDPGRPALSKEQRVDPADHAVRLVHRPCVGRSTEDALAPGLVVEIGIPVPHRRNRHARRHQIPVPPAEARRHATDGQPVGQVRDLSCAFRVVADRRRQMDAEERNRPRRQHLHVGHRQRDAVRKAEAIHADEREDRQDGVDGALAILGPARVRPEGVVRTP